MSIWITKMITWVLAFMLYLQPNAPWISTYQATAISIVNAVANSKPLYKGKYGKEKTIVLLVSLAWFESRFNTMALGDHGQAHGLYQQHDHGPLSDATEATNVAIQQIRISFKICKNNKANERLGWYAAGGSDCTRGLQKSRHRILKAEWLFKKFPPPAEIDDEL